MLQKAFKLISEDQFLKILSRNLRTWWQNVDDFQELQENLQIDNDKGNKRDFGSTRENITGESNIKTVNI